MKHSNTRSASVLKKKKPKTNNCLHFPTNPTLQKKENHNPIFPSVAR